MPGLNRQSLFRALRDGRQRDDAVRQILRDVGIRAGTSVWRPVEVELYVQSDLHPDPFVHADPRQAREGWYVHRRGGTLKNGTFKGLDLTFGDPTLFGGLLLRSIAQDGRLVSGPCNVVHAFMEELGCEHVRAFDARVDELELIACPPLERPVYTTGRVGLGIGSDHHRASRERYLTLPRAIKKGRAELLEALIADGMSTEAIRALTGSPARVIERRRDASVALR